MINFGELKVNTKKVLVGPKVPVSELLDQELIVHWYKVTPSTQKNGTDCLHLQISIGGIQKVVFTSGKILIDQLNQIAEKDFPFTAKIKKVNDKYSHYEFYN